MPEFITLEKIAQDIYFGTGIENPPITARLTRLEDHKEVTNERFDKYDKLLDKMLWFGMSLAVSVIGILVKTIFFH